MNLLEILQTLNINYENIDIRDLEKEVKIRYDQSEELILNFSVLQADLDEDTNDIVLVIVEEE